jgi:GTP cyclohydrolase I
MAYSSRKIAEDIENFLSVRYEDWIGKEQFKGTADRLVRMVDELCWPIEKITEECEKYFKSTFKDSYDEMLVEGPITAWTLCPHHLLPCRFTVFVGYTPNGNVLGLSKFSRLAIVMAKRPIMQESYSRELAELINNKLKPTGVGVYVVGSHGCMSSRGIQQQDTVVSTSVLLGAFKEDPKTRQEFFNIVGRRAIQ